MENQIISINTHDCLQMFTPNEIREMLYFMLLLKEKPKTIYCVFYINYYAIIQHKYVSFQFFQT